MDGEGLRVSPRHKKDVVGLEASDKLWVVLALDLVRVDVLV